MGKKGLEIRLPLHQNGDSAIVFRPDIKTILLLFTVFASVLVAATNAINWYRDSQRTIRHCGELEQRVNTLEIVVTAEQTSQRILMKAIIKKLMPENADIIIKQSDEMKDSIIKTMKEQQKKEMEVHDGRL